MSRLGSGAETEEVSVITYYPVLRDPAIVEETLDAVTKHAQFEVARVSFGESDNQLYCDVGLHVPLYSPTSEVAEVCQLILALILGGKQIPDWPISALQALVSGRWEVLLNIAESAWLEAIHIGFGCPHTATHRALELNSGRSGHLISAADALLPVAGTTTLMRERDDQQLIVANK